SAGTTAPGSSTATKASQVKPDRLGVFSTWSRLVANTSEAVNARIERAAPKMAERIGTAVRPRPGTSAIRRPAAIAGDEEVRPRTPARTERCPRCDAWLPEPADERAALSEGTDAAA